MTNSTITAVLNQNNATDTEQEAFTYLTGDYLVNGSQANNKVTALKAFYHIGQFMAKLTENNTPAIAKQIREQHFVGDDKLMSNNEFTGCKKLYSESDDYSGLKKWYIDSDLSSINAARIWAAYRKHLKGDTSKVKTPFEKAKQALTTYNNIVEADEAEFSAAEMKELNGMFSKFNLEVAELAAS